MRDSKVATGRTFVQVSKSLFIALIRKTSFSYFKKISSLFHGQFLLSFYMSDVKYNCCTARHMGEKLSDFSNVPNVKGLLIK